MNSPKRIAMFCHDDPLAPAGSQETGGQAVYVHQLVKELNKRAYYTDIFLRSDSLHKKSLSYFGKKARVIRLKGGPQKYISRRELFDFLPEIYKSFLEFIEGKDQYDLYHGHYWDGGWLAMKASEQFHKPFIENFHSIGKIREQTRKKYSFTSAVKDIFDKRFLIEKEIVEKAHAIISLAESEKNILQEHYAANPEKVHVIPGGVDDKIFFPIPKEEARKKTNFGAHDFILLFVGRLEWRKGIGTLIYASELIKKEIPNVKVFIIGGKIHGRQKNVDDFYEYERLMDVVNAKNLQDTVSFLGSIEHNRLPLFYSASDVFVVPSYYEPFGLVVLESMACKTPVVASKVDGLTATVKDHETGLLFEPRNAKDLFEKIMILFRSKDLAKKLGDSGYNNVSKKYHWSEIAKQISIEYDKLIRHENTLY